MGIYLPNRFFGSGHGSLIPRHSRLVAFFLRITGFPVAHEGLAVPLRGGIFLLIFFLRSVRCFVIMLVYPHSLPIIIHAFLIGFLPFLGGL